QQFASIASHDLQEPLRKIKMFTSVLKKNWSDILPAEGKVVMNKITASSDRMAQLIKEVLEYSKIAYGTREFIRTDLHAILQNVLGDVDLLLEETSAEIDYQEPLPVIDAIPLQMHQLFYNLLTNALKFRKSNTQPKVRIAARFLSATDMQNFSSLAVNTPYIDVTVSDNGIGFNAQFSKQIFQIFERLHSTEEYEGTGVGLALCEKIVENHRGHIYAVSKEGEGASFHVILPVKQ
ncbi:MAG TPA: ATP-binding protein, partial [Flavisolibacter sp.]|nr:ATP-binding protein [Flavisolibacter sp.]